MGLYTKLITTFLFSLAWGLSLYTPLVNTQVTGVGFLKLCLKITLGSLFLLLAFFIAANLDPLAPLMLIFYTLLALSCLTFYIHQDKKSKFMWVIFFISQFLFWLLFNRLALLFSTSHFPLFQYLHLLSSCLFLGLITFAMILGHWYLVTPKLSEKPLIYASYLIWFFIFLKVVMTAYTYFTNPQYFMEQTELAEGYMFNWLLLSMRVLWGYVVIGVMSYFSYRLIKMRSIQSATGILYVMTFFVFIGELISTYLFFKHGLSL